MSLPPTVRVFVAVEPIDMRGSFDAIAGAVRRIGLDPVDGLHWKQLLASSWMATDGTGLKVIVPPASHRA